jgi:hypothetical protein
LFFTLTRALSCHLHKPPSQPLFWHFRQAAIVSPEHTPEKP